ncbi:unnamed protein product [Medioppia subpectinata]|uniref:CCZ1/INTU second Longin domain-containing protein n=1 Tax=Medioppia subpectinata TaxID=1979941 RepID=A0A7R9KHF3_9ACAR|nr:unnamed protein product [Medioppia subpectinata]CAG2103605.1 unnamed protein product [Medioppia subpectinata]
MRLVNRVLNKMEFEFAEDKHNDKLSDECHPKDTHQKANQLNERFGLKYKRLTSWVFRNKSSKQSTDKSLKRKSSCRKEVPKDTDEASDDNKLVLMYLMPSNDTQTDCLLYSYPKTETEDSDQVLLKLKGMFITLSQAVYQFTQQSICLSSIEVNQQNSKQLYRIGFVHQMNGLLVLALPYDTYTDVEVEAIVETIARAFDWISEEPAMDSHEQSGAPFIVIGSCLLYKGLLLSSQLAVNHLKDIFAFLSLKGLLSLHKTDSIRLVYTSLHKGLKFGA